MTDEVNLEEVEDGKLNEALGVAADATTLSDDEINKLSEADQKKVAEEVEVEEE